ncbi:MAG TPA: SCO family protein [Pirellulales bacterium]|jgi:protein SCO1/2|nr:SCO family protein [Pirellulales bacterium]
MTVSPVVARTRIILWTLVVVAALAATALYVFKPPTVPVGVSGTPFTLSSTKGGEFTQADLKGTPSLVFFGYTFCPDVCPTTMAESVQWREELGIKPEQLRTIFVTVDPERDTKQVLTEYLAAFDPNIIGLVGDADQTSAAKASFGVFSEKGQADNSGGYLVNHTANVFLIGKDGEFEGTIAYGEDKQSAEAKIKRLIGR